MLSERAKQVVLLRILPFVERNLNLVELGPRGTGKSHLFQQISPYSHLISGGKATVAKMFVNNANGQRGLVCQYDVVCFDEISGVSFDQKDGVNIMKGYMASGEFSRGKESIRAEGGIVMVGNFDVDIGCTIGDDEFRIVQSFDEVICGSYKDDWEDDWGRTLKIEFSSRTTMSTGSSLTGPRLRHPRGELGQRTPLR